MTSEPVTGERDTGRPTIFNTKDCIFVERIRTVSSSDFGGGSSGHETGGTPGDMVSTTPPTPSLTETADVSGESETSFYTDSTTQLETDSDSETEPVIVSTRDGSTQTSAFCVNSFSSKTCLELLQNLTDEQLQFELQYFKMLGCDIPVRSQASKFKAASISRELNKLLTKQTCLDFNITIESCDLIINSFSYLVDRAQNEIDKLHAPVAESYSPVTVPPVLDDVRTSLDVPTPLVTEVKPELPSSVCRLCNNVDFSDLSVAEILDQLQISHYSSSGRKTAYYGDLPYSYGDVHHKPCPYPKGELFDTIFSRIQTNVDPDFNQSNYTCLVTLSTL